MKPPASALVAGLLFLVSAVHALITGTMGLALFEAHASGLLLLVVALIQVYVGLGLFAGDGFARTLALWALGIGFMLSWYAMFQHSTGGTATFTNIAPSATKIFVACFFAWHLSGHGALEHTGDIPAHDDHAHGEHAH